ncbi:hypothetical protein [Streptomyces sp. SM12]|uniref:hypothetical protein n=1 Tax=Streptomyces sp. SM12 TaxID=1071602 RepID=UPI000CD4B698|nr:hypothetical protein [Streptomyces sp. SM12]
MPSSPIDTENLAPAVAEALGPGWASHADKGWPFSYLISHRDGRTLRLRPSRWPFSYLISHRDGRTLRLRPSGYHTCTGQLLAFGVHPDRPDDVHLNPYTSGIEFGYATVSPTKTAAQIAAHLTRRRGLIATLTAAHHEWNARVAQARTDEAQRTAAAEQLAAVPGMARPYRRVDKEEPVWYLDWEGPCRIPGGSRRYFTTPMARVAVDADVQDGVTVCVELTGLTADHAARVLRVLTA